MDEDGGGENGGPVAVFIPDGALGNRSGLDNFVGDFPDFFFLVVAFIRIKFHAKNSCKHARRKVLSIFTRLFLCPAVGMGFGEVAVLLRFFRKRHPDGGSNEAVGLVRGTFSNDCEKHLAGREVFQTGFSGDQFAIGWIDA